MTPLSTHCLPSIRTVQKLHYTTLLYTHTHGMEQIPFNQVSHPRSSSFTNAAFQPDSTFRAQVQGLVPAQSQNTSLNSTATATATATANMPTNPSIGASVASQSQIQPQLQTQTQTQSQIQPEDESGTQKGGPTATAPFLQDFSLVAEAAKRAQMAVVMRDLEGISL